MAASASRANILVGLEGLIFVTRSRVQTWLIAIILMAISLNAKLIAKLHHFDTCPLAKLARYRKRFAMMLKIVIK